MLSTSVPLLPFGWVMCEPVWILSFLVCCSTSPKPSTVVSTKEELANTALFLSTSNLSYNVPLRKHPSAQGQAIVDVDKHLGHCLWSLTCLMTPLTEVPCGEIHKFIRNQLCNLKPGKRSLILLYCPCWREALLPHKQSDQVFVCFLCCTS